jgi:mannose-6-phosphate isomerase-like protein (cupin superfamily)
MIPKYLAPEAGELIHLQGKPRILKLTPAETAGVYLQFETTHAPGSSVFPKCHRDDDKAFYLQAGHCAFLVGDRRITASAGAFAFVPHETVHAFTNSGLERGRMLVTVTPGTPHEGLSRAVEVLAGESGQQPAGAQQLALAAQYGWVMEPPLR